MKVIKKHVLNWRGFSYFRTFTHGIITQNTTHSYIYIYIHAYIYIYIYIYRGHSATTSLGKLERVDNESNKKHRKESVQSKKWYHSHKFFCVLFSVKQSFRLGFSWSYDNITANNKKRTSKKEPTSVSKIII